MRREPPDGPDRSADRHAGHGNRGRDLPPAYDDLDGRLRRAFSEVHMSAAPEALRVSLETLPSRTEPRRAPAWSQRHRFAGIAAVIVAVALLGAAIAGRFGSGPASAPPSGSPSPTEPRGTAAATAPSGVPPVVIPWADATPPPQAERPTARPVPPGTRACAPADLRATAAWGGATGSMAGGIGVTNVSSSACVIDGAPKLVEIQAGTATLSTAYSTAPGPGPAGAGPPGPALLEPGDYGRWWLFWQNWCGQDLLATALVVTLPDGSGPLVATADPSSGPGMAGKPRCDASGSPSSLSVTAFEYEAPEPPLLEPQPASASIAAPSTAIAGQDVKFTVELTNLGDKAAVFDPCPTYSEDLLVGGLRLKPPADRHYALNCPALAKTLAPGATIVLEMRYPIQPGAPAGPAELLWSMDPGGPFSTGAFGRVPITIVGPEQATPSS